MHVIFFLIFGLIVGFIARLIVSGNRSMGLLETSLLGVFGSILGGVLGNLFAGGQWNKPVTAGWIGSIVGAVLILAIMGRVRSAKS